MSEQCVIAEYASRTDALTALAVLETYGFTTDSVSVAWHKDDPALQPLHSAENPEEAEVSGEKATGLGVLLGGAVSAPLAASTMIGNLFLVGPLAGMAVGAVAGGLWGSARHWGVDREQSRTYEQRVREGAVLVIVNGRAKRLDEAERGLATTKPVSLERFTFPEPPAARR